MTREREREREGGREGERLGEGRRASGTFRSISLFASPHASQQLTSPTYSFLSLKLPPLPCAVLLAFMYVMYVCTYVSMCMFFLYIYIYIYICFFIV